MTNSQSVGVFVPTTNVWDVNEIYSTEVTSPAFKELLVRLYQNLNNMAQALNVKDSAIYNTQEFVNGQLYFANPALNSTSTTAPRMRQVMRKVINFGALPNTGTKTAAHGITVNSSTTLTRAYASASDTTGNNYIPIPYASPTLVNNIELKVDGTNVTIITGSNRSAFTVCYVVVEYLTS